MERPNPSRELIETTFNEIFNRIPQRRIRVYTGATGMDNFEEAMDNKMGFYRIYLGRKPSRLIKRLKGKILKSANGRYFRRFKQQ